eukprot:Gb_08056 [translate_table: standard]
MEISGEELTQRRLTEENKGFTLDGSVDLRGRPVQRAKTGRWGACFFLIGYEAFERMAFYGIASNLVIYLTTELHEGTISSARNVNNWSGAVWITPVLGAYIADSHFGRYWTFVVSSLIYLLGMVLLTVAVSLKALKPPPCSGHNSDRVCEKASPLQIGFFYFSLYVLAVGTGGTKPNISTFGADQFDDFHQEEKLQKNSFFNWWMFSVCFGALVAQTVLVYIQDNVGWALGYGIPTAGLFASLLIFLIGTPYYRHKVRNDSPINRVVQVLLAAARKWRVAAPSDPSQLYELDFKDYLATRKRRIPHTPNLRFLDKAATKQASNMEPEAGSELKLLCTVTQVEGTKLMIGMLPIWLATIIPSTVLAQVNTLFVKQGTTMDRHMGHHFQIPAASLGAFITISMLLTVPLYDRYFVPFVRRHTGNPRGITLLQRIGIGCFLHIIIMVVASATEVKRLRVISEHRLSNTRDIVPMSIFWLLPQYVLMGIAEVFTVIAMLEFFYDQSPHDMQSLGTAFFTSSLGVGNFVSSFLLTTVTKITGRGNHKSWIVNNLNDSHLDYYYAFLAILSFLNIIFFLIVSHLYNYKKENNQGTPTPPINQLGFLAVKVEPDTNLNYESQLDGQL